MKKKKTWKKTLNVLSTAALLSSLALPLTPKEVHANATIKPQVLAEQLVIGQDGKVYTWVLNDNEQLGEGTTTDRYTPVQVKNLSNVVAVSTGASHFLALTVYGKVYVLGYNGSGQLGDGTTTIRTTPVEVKNLSNVVAVKGGWAHSLALTADGKVYAWGDNSSGQLGNGITERRLTPVEVQNLSNVVAVSGGGGHSLALTADGKVYAWGYNAYGQLGDGTTTDRTTPVQVQNLSNVVAISGAGSRSFALTADGKVYAWGYNEYGELGDGTTERRLTPVQVKNLSNVVAVSGGNYHSLALTADGKVYAWGRNDYGQLGDGTMTQRLTPVEVQNLSNVVAVNGGSDYSLALTADGKVYGWGWNKYGQLGDGTTENRTTPVQVSSITGNAALAQSTGVPLISDIPTDASHPFAHVDTSKMSSEALIAWRAIQHAEKYPADTMLKYAYKKTLEVPTTDAHKQVIQEYLAHVQKQYDARKTGTKSTAVVRAETRVKALEKMYSPLLLKKAQDAVNALPAGDDKELLQARIDQVVQAQEVAKLQKQVEDATKAVERAESTKVKSDIDRATQLVSALPDGETKQTLLSRLDALKQVTDPAVTKAMEAINLAKKYPTVSYYHKRATDFINQVQDETKREELMALLNTK